MLKPSAHQGGRGGHGGGHSRNRVPFRGRKGANKVGGKVPETHQGTLVLLRA